MGPEVDPVISDAKLPARADVVLIGGGIIGATGALFLAERGLSVVLVEKGQIAGEQSGRNWGWCRQANRDPREFNLIRESLVLWRGLNERIGVDAGFRTTGILFAARDDETEQKYVDWVQLAAAWGLRPLWSGVPSLSVSCPEIARPQNPLSIAPATAAPNLSAPCRPSRSPHGAPARRLSRTAPHAA